MCEAWTVVTSTCWQTCISKSVQYFFRLESAGYKGHTPIPLVKIWASNMKNQRCYAEWNFEKLSWVKKAVSFPYYFAICFHLCNGGVGTSFAYLFSGNGLFEMADAMLGLLSWLNHQRFFFFFLYYCAMSNGYNAKVHWEVRI